MNKKTIIGIIIILVVGIISGYLLSAKITKAVAGIPVGLGTPTAFDNVALTGGLRIAAPTTEYPYTLPQNASEGAGMATLVTAGTCARSTTLCAIITNPFNATSTITFAKVQGINSTSTVNLLMGTTTQTTAITTNSQISPSLINATLSSSTPFYTVAGVRVGPNGGYNDPGANSFISIVVGPLENIAILSTSTSATFPLGNSGMLFPSSTSTMTYSIEWQK